MALSTSVVIILMMIFKDKTHIIRQKWAAMQMVLLGIDFEIEGEADDNADMIILNHQSVVDIIIFEYLYKRNLAWVAKKEIGDLFWFGKILTLPNMIQVERESKSSLVKLIKDVKDRNSKGRPIAIFPEGTRSDGTKMRKFKSGAKIISEKFDFTVQPIIIVGSRKILDSQKFKQQSGTIKIKYLPSIKAEKSTEWYKETEKLMHSTFKEMIQDDI
jgi:1-acyl-sn-glycerol-3-phosphate acyltransferase